MTAVATKAAPRVASKKKAPIPVSPAAPKSQVVDEVFVYCSEEQGEVRIPLRFKTKLLRAVSKLGSEGADDLEQLFALLDGLGDEATSAQIDEMFWDETEDLVKVYFDEFEKKHQATVGE